MIPAPLTRPSATRRCSRMWAALTTPLWAGTDVDGAGNICIGSSVYGFAGENGVTRIGDGTFSGYNACYITGIFGAEVNVGTAVAVYVDDTGKLGTMPVSAPGKQMAVPAPRGAHPQAMLNKSEN